MIDHCTFITKGACIALFHDAWAGAAWGDGSWAKPLTLGTSEAVYIEDNDFSTSPPMRRAVLDEYAGARFVFRHNNCTNAVVASHGTGSTGRDRSVRQWEIYSNTFTASPSSATEAIHMRGGTGVVFDNKIIGFAKLITLHTYRFHTSFPKWSGSDGTSGWDLNDPKLYASGRAGVGSGIGPGGVGGKLVVSGANWTANEWRGFSVRNLDGLSNAQPSHSKGAGPGPFFSSIVSNTSDTAIVKGGSQQPNKMFAPGDRFEIRKVIQGLDMIGASTGDLLSGNKPAARWLHQKIEAAYVWNNTKDGIRDAGVAIAGDPEIKDGIHFLNNQVKPEYIPFAYPHPLTK